MQDVGITTASAEEEINPLYYLVVILKHKKLIGGITFLSALGAVVVSLILPPIYRAEARILPPQTGSSSMAAQMLREIGAMAGPFAGLLGIENIKDVYAGMLKSRTMYDWIIEDFDLMELYGAKVREDARARLDDALSVQVGKDGIISIAVEDKDPKRAADMANAFVARLKEWSGELALTEAQRKKVFLEEQFNRVKENLAKAENDLQEFQEKTGVVMLNQQGSALIGSIAQLRAQIAAKEVELEVMRTYATAGNPDRQRLEEELKGMKEQLSKLEASSADNPGSLVPTGKMAEVSTEYLRKSRELRYEETLYDLIAKQYEMARVEEASDPPIVQELDKALPPNKRAKPNRKLIVVVATFGSFFFALLAAFLMEYIEKVSTDPQSKELVNTLRRYASLRAR